jgi:PPOX class probable F420-dependent enzyme
VTVEAQAARRMFGSLPVVNVATVDADGAPHVVPLWFVWPEDGVYISVSRESRTWRNAEADPRVALTVDLGRSWQELAGIEVRGRVELLPNEHPELRHAMSAWHDKYRALLSGDGFSMLAAEVVDLGFMRLTPERILGWDHARG